jgi:hypothetical protein
MIQRKARSRSHSEFQIRAFALATDLLPSEDMKSCFDPVVDTIIEMVAKQVQDVVEDGSPPVEVCRRGLPLPCFQLNQFRTSYLLVVSEVPHTSGSGSKSGAMSMAGSVP